MDSFGKIYGNCETIPLCQDEERFILELKNLFEKYGVCVGVNNAKIYS